jgi:RHS repeat-associated protein
MTSAGPVTYTYDNDGNQISQRVGSTTTSFSYNFEKQLTKVSRGSSTLGAYAYSPSGMKILTIESGTTTVSLNQGVNVVYEKNTGGSTTINDYLYAGGLLIAKLSSSTILYHHQDHLGNTRLVTQGSTTNFSSNYQPYGLQYGASGTDPVYKYTEKPQSQSTGLYYYGARWYNSTLGRFLTRDPNAGKLSNPQSLNLYTYVHNNPVGYVDRTGTADCVAWNLSTWGGCLTDVSSATVTFATTVAKPYVVGTIQVVNTVQNGLQQAGNYVYQGLQVSSQYIQQAGNYIYGGLQTGYRSLAQNTQDLAVYTFNRISQDPLAQAFNQGLKASQDFISTHVKDPSKLLFTLVTCGALVGLGAVLVTQPEVDTAIFSNPVTATHAGEIMIGLVVLCGIGICEGAGLG